MSGKRTPAKREPDKIAGHFRRGRPAPGEERPELSPVSFLADAKTLADIQELEDALPKEIRQRRSVAIREIIQDGAERRRRANAKGAN